MALNQRLERLDGLHPLVQAAARELLARCQTELQRMLMVVYGWRSLQEQRLIYQKGRLFNQETHVWEVTDPSQIVTRALPGTSAHNVITAAGAPAAMGLDVIPLLADGTADWNVSDDFWTGLYAIAWKVGLDPYGDPIGAYMKTDKGHFEEPWWHGKLDALQLLLPVNPGASSA